MGVNRHSPTTEITLCRPYMCSASSGLGKAPLRLRTVPAMLKENALKGDNHLTPAPRRGQ